MAIQKDSKVRLKDIPSPEMIVWEIDPDVFGNWICHWFDGSTPMKESYPGEMLEEVAPPQITGYGFA